MTLAELYEKVNAPIRDAYRQALKEQARDDEWHRFLRLPTSATSMKRIG